MSRKVALRQAPTIRPPVGIKRPSPQTVAGWEELVEQVKDLQRNDPAAREQWIVYTDHHANGTRDPTKHDADMLQGFLAAYSSGERYEVPKDDPSEMAQFIRLGQKKSAAWKSVWSEYCAAHGGGTCDPMKHEADFLYKFFDYIGHRALKGPTMLGMGMPFSLMSGPPTKMLKGALGQAIPSRMGMLGMGGVDPLKMELVNMVKSLQRTNADAKVAWGSWCEAQPQKKRDPMAYDETQLQDFLSLSGFDGLEQAGGGGGGGGLIAASGFGSGGGKVDPAKARLVARIKEYQRGADEQREAWASFCDSMPGKRRDPNSHEIATLRDFISSYGVP